MNVDSQGNSYLYSGNYIKKGLKAIVVEAPWGETTDEFLESINADLGAALEKLVPSAFDASFKEVDVVKKG